MLWTVLNALLMSQGALTTEAKATACHRLEHPTPSTEDWFKKSFTLVERTVIVTYCSKRTTKARSQSPAHAKLPIEAKTAICKKLELATPETDHWLKSNYTLSERTEIITHCVALAGKR